MVIHRGDVWWAELDDPRGSEPGFRRPLVIVQADAFNASRIQTVVGVAVTSNLRLIDAPGNVLLRSRASACRRIQSPMSHRSSRSTVEYWRSAQGDSTERRWARSEKGCGSCSISDRLA
jgi:mRNA-degrading endonuclease toxin of MazEF toxin-antitoxin module